MKRHIHKNGAERESTGVFEKIQEKTKIDHIDSHVHTHAIPNIFKLTVKLAKEYEIPYIRTQFEKPYFVPDKQKYFNLKYPVNILKIILLNSFTVINKIYLCNKELRTNDYLIGVGYTGMMNEMTVEYGLKALNNDDFVAEALIHPCDYDESVQDSHYTEFLITQNESLKNKISEMDIELISHNSAY